MRSERNPAPDSSHCNFKVNQATLSSIGRDQQDPLSLLMDTFMGTYWPIWQEALYKMTSRIILSGVSHGLQGPSSVHFAPGLLSCSRPQA